MAPTDSVPDYLWQAAVLLVAILVFQVTVRGELTLSIAIVAVLGFILVSIAVDAVRRER